MFPRLLAAVWGIVILCYHVQLHMPGECEESNELYCGEISDVWTEALQRNIDFLIHT